MRASRLHFCYVITAKSWPLYPKTSQNRFLHMRRRPVQLENLPPLLTWPTLGCSWVWWIIWLNFCLAYLLQFNRSVLWWTPRGDSYGHHNTKSEESAIQAIGSCSIWSTPSHHPYDKCFLSLWSRTCTFPRITVGDFYTLCNVARASGRQNPLHHYRTEDGGCCMGDD